MYKGYSTAICAVCQGELEKGKRPEDIIAQTKQREEDAAIKAIDDIGPGNFRVMGIGKRMREVLEKVKAKAQGRRRGSLFSEKDEKK